MELTITGSGTLLPDDAHRSAGHLLEWAGGRLLLDCGSGVVHGLARDGRDWRGITHVALSHFHTDHVGDLPALLWAWTHAVPEGERPPRTILGPAGTLRFLHALREAHGDHVLAPGGPLRIVELRQDDVWEDPGAGLVMRTHRAAHTPEAVAFRVEGRGGALGYTGDTGPCEGLGRFFRGVRVLVAECAVEEGAAVPIHLSPRQVAELACEAEPETLVLTHLYPEVDRTTLVDRLRRAGVRARIHVAVDGLRLDLRS